MVEARAALPDCLGNEPTQGKWYGAVRGELPGFLVCAACYEDKIVGTFYAHNFGPVEVGGRRVCHFSNAFIERSYTVWNRHVKAGADWKAFVRDVQVRLATPPCEHQHPSGASDRVWVCAIAQPDVKICQAHYLDALAYTPFTHQFLPIGNAASVANRKGRLACAVGHQAILHALGAALDTCDLYSFLDVARFFSTHKPCPGMKASWSKCHVLRSYAGSFILCSACFAAYVRPLGLTLLFSAEDHSMHRFKCSFLHNPRAATIRAKILELVNKNMLVPLTSYLALADREPACPGSAAVSGVPRYRFPSIPGLAVCTECAMTMVAGTFLWEKMVPEPRTESALVCALGTRALRARFFQAIRPVHGREMEIWLTDARAAADGASSEEKK